MEKCPNVNKTKGEDYKTVHKR